jgi:hypothetical protein
MITGVRILAPSSEEEMVAVFLRGELASERFGDKVRDALRTSGESERLLTDPDLGDACANEARGAVLAATRGYGEDRELFEFFPANVAWVWARVTAAELARVRYIEYSYWNEISSGSRLASDAAARIDEGVQLWGVSNERFHKGARALLEGEQFPPLILVGVDYGDLVCLEGNLRLTAHALAGFPIDADCLVGTAPTLARWAG